jgi:hypothetical protein
MKHIAILIILLLAWNVCLPQTWEDQITLPTAVLGASSAASNGYGIHLAGVYSGAVKEYYLNNSGSQVFGSLNVSGGEYPVVTNFNGVVRVTMKLGSNISIYQSLDGGNSWSSFAQYNPIPSGQTTPVPIYNLDAYSDRHGTHIVWSDVEVGSENTPSYYPGNIYYVRYDDNRQQFYGFKKVNDIASPAKTGYYPRVTASATKAHVLFPSPFIASRDLDLSSETWDASYKTQSNTLTPLNSLNAVVLGSTIYAVGQSEEILGTGNNLYTIMLTKRDINDATWGNGTNFTGSSIPGINIHNLAKVDEQTFRFANYRYNDTYGCNIMTVWTYSTAGTEGWSSTYNILPYLLAGGSMASNIFAVGGQFGTYCLWTETVTMPSTTTHLEMKRAADAATVTLPFSATAHWNMLSLPVGLINFTPSTVWSGTSAIQKFVTGSGCMNADYLVDGAGYWVNYDNAASLSYVGAQLNKVTVPVKAGWNIVGAVAQSIPLSNITTTPAGILDGSIFGFAFNSGYTYAQSINPGYGYWIKTTQDGLLTMDPSLGSGGPPGGCIPPPQSPVGEPQYPIPYTPTYGASNQPTSLTLTWQELSGVTYKVQYTLDQDFSTGITEYSGLTVPQKTITGLSNSSTYYWRVFATNTHGTSIPSCIYNFTTAAPSGGGGGGGCVAASVAVLDQFTVTDAAGNSQSLYSVNGGRSVNLGAKNFDLPPATPKGIFHGRFKSGKFIETTMPGRGQSKIPITVKDAKYPLTLHWNLHPENATKYWLDKPGNGHSQIGLSGTGSVALNSTNSGDLVIIAQSVSPPPCEMSKTAIRRGQVGDISSQPTSYVLQQNMPNPFNPSTMINYELPEAAHVTLKVFNMLGQEVATLVDGMEDAGYKTARFDGSNLSSGVYFYRITAGAFSDIKKMILVK